ncbi:MAG TPA: Gfo/Idh/MocA family oxidoreductase [Verrucomicrobiota bacterium]|nr:dehydrogenase [Verrucomicrobiales bacterium]HRI13630.1 Gfo/Idh/MocA family oxidoreductase [Verrucomicrobiota bacterium]
MKTNRRDFLRASALAGASLAATPRLFSAESAPAPGSVIGANGDIRVAVIGFNGRGKDHISGFKGVKGVRLVALCDVDSEVMGKEAQRLADAGTPVKTYTDVRKLLESSEIDAISTATPNHWHSLIGIWGCQLGKDVYVEKPVSHNVWEGRQLVNAARKYNRIVQTGTQSRSNPGLREAVEWVRAGNLGDIKLVTGLCYKPRQSIGKVTAPTPVPATIDYDLWCGPTPVHPLMRQKLHYDWHWVFETGNGDLGNQGIHQMDIARWILGEEAVSPVVFSVGGRFGYIDDGNTPNTQVVYHGYKNAPLIFEVRGLPKSKEFQDPKLWNANMDDYRGSKIGVVVECANGRMVIPSYDSAIAYDASGQEVKRFKGGADHYANFIEAVRARDPKKLNADILEGHLSSALCHTGNVSYRLGENLSPGALKERVQGNASMADAVGRMTTHLSANGVDLAKTPVTLGALLHMDPTTERFEKNGAANNQLAAEGRPGFTVPARV